MISISFLNSIYSKKDTIKLIDNLNNDVCIHVDLMDGIYVEENNFTIEEILGLLKHVNKPLDIHLMVSDPIKYIDDLSTLNPKYITFHPDASDNPVEVINKIKEYNIKAGIAINSFIDIKEYEELYKDVDLVLVMSVKAGYGGQKFLPETFDKLTYLNSIKYESNFITEVDGGIDDVIYGNLKSYNVDMVVVGSYICMNENFERPLNKLL